ncbi:MAG: hypothetical protein JSV98_02465 [candidate division WOR-3 bacterium]|nr:MAG: hypothetical protein JSV98_02465 [candidate division WOR-3 bacterium]
MLLIIVLAILAFVVLRKRERYVMLEEIIPEGEVLSAVDGIIKYKGVQYILGTTDLGKKKHLLDKLNLLEVEEIGVIDMRYRGQIILRNEIAYDVLRRK